MELPESTRKAKARYKKEKRYSLTAEMPIEKRDFVWQVAGKFGLSLTQLVQNAIEEYSRNHMTVAPVFPHKAEDLLTERENLLIERFGRLSPTTQLDFLHLLEDFVESLGTQSEEATVGE